MRRFGFIVRGGEIDEGFAQDAAHARGFGFFGDGIFEVVHVGKSGDAAANHFRSGEARAPTDEIFGDIFGFGGENIFASQSSSVTSSLRPRSSVMGT